MAGGNMQFGTMVWVMTQVLLTQDHKRQTHRRGGDHNRITA